MLQCWCHFPAAFPLGEAAGRRESPSHDLGDGSNPVPEATPATPLIPT